MYALLLGIIAAQNTFPDVGEGEKCGGLLGIQCRQGLVCEFPPAPTGVDVSDEQGKCIPAEVSILPIPNPPSTTLGSTMTATGITTTATITGFSTTSAIATTTESAPTFASNAYQLGPFFFLYLINL
jgi:hypothetical protein